MQHLQDQHISVDSPCTGTRKESRRGMWYSRQIWGNTASTGRCKHQPPQNVLLCVCVRVVRVECTYTCMYRGGQRVPGTFAALKHQLMSLNIEGKEWHCTGCSDHSFCTISPFLRLEYAPNSYMTQACYGVCGKKRPQMCSWSSQNMNGFSPAVLS